MQRTAGDLRIWYLLALLAQAGAAYAPLASMLHVLSIWNVIHLRGFEFLLPGAYAAILASFLLLTALLGLALKKAWGWSWAVMIDAGVFCLVVLAVISKSRPPFWPSFFFVAAGAVMMTPGVRAFYSRAKRPWLMRWWACGREGRAEFLVRAVVGGGQVLFSAGILLIMLPSPYWPADFLLVLLFCAAGIFGGVKLSTGKKAGFYLTIAWCALGVWIGLNAWRKVRSSYYAPARDADLCIWVAAGFLVLGICTSAALARDIAHQRRRNRSGPALDREQLKSPTFP